MIGGCYPDPRLRPITLGGRTSYRCPSCLTNGAPSHVVDSDDCKAMRVERDLSRRS